METSGKRKHSDGPSSDIWDYFIKNSIDSSKPVYKKCQQIVSRESSTGNLTHGEMCLYWLI